MRIEQSAKYGRGLWGTIVLLVILMKGNEVNIKTEDISMRRVENAIYQMEREEMEKFEAAWEYLKENEGGYNNDSNDRGGATKYGISLRFLEGLSKDEGDINGDGRVDIKDIQDLGEEEAKKKYEEYFWIPAKCEEIRNPNIAIKVFDICVNFGVKKGIRILQTAVNKTYEQHLLKVDGVIGSKTLKEVNNSLGNNLMENIISETIDAYEEIVNRNPNQEKFLKGWIRRARRVPTMEGV